MEKLTLLIQNLWSENKLSKEAYAELLTFTNNHQNLQLHKTKVMPCFYDHTEIPKVSSDDSDYSEDVFIIDEDGMNGLAYYCFRDSKWYFHTDTLVDYFEEGNETKWKWYYPIANIDLVFPK